MLKPAVGWWCDPAANGSRYVIGVRVSGVLVPVSARKRRWQNKPQKRC
jgi:hypothetical protein